MTLFLHSLLLPAEITNPLPYLGRFGPAQLDALQETAVSATWWLIWVNVRLRLALLHTRGVLHRGLEQHGDVRG